MRNLKLSLPKLKLILTPLAAIAMGTLAFGTSARAVESIIPVGAIIMTPISVSQPAEMRFGTIAAGATAGQVLLELPLFLSATQPTTSNPTIVGDRSATGGSTLIGGTTCSATTVCGVGSIQVTGQNSGTFTKVTMPGSITLSSGANTMTVTSLTSRYGAPGTAGVTSGAAAFNASGAATVIFAGTLQVGASQASGSYSGNMTVDIDY